MKKTYGPKQLDNSYSIKIDYDLSMNLMELYIYKDSKSINKKDTRNGTIDYPILRTVDGYIVDGCPDSDFNNSKHISIDNKLVELIKNEISNLPKNLKKIIPKNERLEEYLSY